MPKLFFFGLYIYKNHGFKIVGKDNILCLSLAWLHTLNFEPILNRGSYMSAYVLLNLLNEEKR